MNITDDNIIINSKKKLENKINKWITENTEVKNVSKISTDFGDTEVKV